MLNVTERPKAGSGGEAEADMERQAPPPGAAGGGPAGSPMIIVLGAVALISMIFGFVLGRLL